jgi:uncharacterized protein YndB with AHSA1/START domain
MPNILHRLSIDAPPEDVHQLAATREGIQQWWTGQPVVGDDNIGGQLSVYFRDPAEPAATFEVVERRPEQIVWRCVEGPHDWIDTRITFALKPRADGATTLLFSHAGWQQENEFMNRLLHQLGLLPHEPQIRSRRPWLQRLPRRRDQPLGLKASYGRVSR